ncbi:hypothetical protein L1987_67602 [Smallanthus sonchifolius]|uniref:Uncharacterized protein n=1 Tax=Smallanthus sonchifolius TaxID=185202 RepID=A0ACB9B2G7_9ASTR|nr:hypothetical protein L1987_67602 [Smallanthus sonchifolius]
MRAGGFTIQQALSADAASIIKQAVTLARRRGHAQVTPLHVANSLLSSTTGLLRAACLQSQSTSHPLQCKALELCFNVALNRLPTSSSSPMLNPNHSTQHPSISNALVAAFKRAQAHQRRGSIENQQQPLLAVKIELEQLIISILDDPSVSRVMREAGFSSTQVKTNVEQVVSLELSSHTPPPIASKDTMKHNDHQVMVRNEDVMCVIENLLNKKRFVVVGECIATIEGVVGKVMEKVDKGEVPEALKDVKFIRLPLFSFGQLSRGDVEHKLGELRSLVKGYVQRGVVLYVGDLKWIYEYRTSSMSHGRGYYCPIEHLIIELGRLVSGINDTISAKIWVMAISSFQTYMKCRNENPSLDIILKLHPLTIPAGSLSLSLVPQSDTKDECRSKNSDNGDIRMMLKSGEEQQLTCCFDCSMNFKSEAKSYSRSSSLPSWLADEKIVVNNQDQECVSVKELCKKWNSICTSVHRTKPLFQRSLSFSSVSPSSPASCFSYIQENPNSNRTSKLLDFTALEKNLEPYSYQLHDDHHEVEPRQRFPSNSTPNSVSSSDVMEVEYVQKFREFNGENLKVLCNALEEKVPWQKDIVPDIASTILRCRSGMLRRKDHHDEPKEETWFFFQGIDSQLKEKIAKELAKIVFGSCLNFVTISLSNFSTSSRVEYSTDEPRNKRSRDEQSCSYLERFAEAVSMNPHRVFFVEDVDYWSQMGIKRAIERGKLTHSSGEEVGFHDAIIVLSCESFSSRRTCSPPVKQKVQEEGSPCASLDLNISFDEYHDEEQSMSMDDHVGLLESVDKCINFNIQDLSL